MQLYLALIADREEVHDAWVARDEGMPIRSRCIHNHVASFANRASGTHWWMIAYIEVRCSDINAFPGVVQGLERQWTVYCLLDSILSRCQSGEGDGSRLRRMERKQAAEVARVRHLDHLNLTVQNLTSSLAFYRDLFGFEVVEIGPPDPVPWAIVKSGEAMLCLYEHAGVPQGPHFPQAPQEQGMRHFALRILNGSEFYSLLQKRGVPLHFEGPVRWPHSTSYYISDPSGHHIEVVAWDEDKIAFEPSRQVSEKR